MASLPTLSDGTAGGIEADSITLPLCQALIDDFRLVAEADIAEAMRNLLLRQRVLGEGAAACAVAGYIQRRADLEGNVVVLVCGGNVSIGTLREVFSAQT